MKNILVLLLAGVLFACSSSLPEPSTEPSSELQQSLIACPEQRPQVCTMDYRPVCATRDTGIRCVTTPCPSSEQKTYSNGCSACADQAVVGYIPDECPSSVTP
jgi:hypothetical protein